MACCHSPLFAADFTILNPGNNWFWGAGDPIMTAGDVWSAVTLKYGQGATTILNVPPASAGDVPASITAALLGFQEMWLGTFTTAIASLSSPVSGPCPGLSATIDVTPSAVFDQLVGGACVIVARVSCGILMCSAV
jgi:hypothetical protein